MLFEVCATVAAVRGLRAPFEGGRGDRATARRTGGGETSRATHRLGGRVDGTRRGGGGLPRWGNRVAG